MIYIAPSIILGIAIGCAAMLHRMGAVEKRMDAYDTKIERLDADVLVACERNEKE